MEGVCKWRFYGAMLDLTVPQRSLNRLLFTNLLTAVVILSVTFFGYSVSELLNIVHNPLVVTKLACCYLVIANASLAAKLDKDGHASAKSTKSTRSQVRMEKFRVCFCNRYRLTTEVRRG